jgi:drug/metabolite transporter (DMT)-like permease
VTQPRRERPHHDIHDVGLIRPEHDGARRLHLRRECATIAAVTTTAFWPTRARTLSARTLGALAVAGVVIAFSLSSTLVKRADTPGVLVAFWRLITATIVWNAFLWSTGRRVTMRHVRQALVPGAFFGLNLAIFFAGATHNSVANAALIGSLAPFFIVPIGAWLFREFNDRRALIFALIAFGGVGLVLFSAPATGDASFQGNVFGFVAMLLLTAYVVSTRQFRHDMDVAVFMATICPIAALAVLPLAVANGDVFAMSGTGWTYMLILTFVSGIAANGLMVYAQKAIPIGTIAIAQVVQPALAVVWSFLLLGETLRAWQVVGIAIAISGLFAFILMNQRGDRARRAEEPVEPPIANQEPAAALVR